MIGITQRLEQNKSYFEIRECLSLDWGRFLCDLDFVPLSYEKPINKYNINALILSGGNDLSHLNQNNLSEIRDKYEKCAIEHCVESNIPIFAICRGAQYLAYYFGSVLEKLDNHINKNHIITFQNNNYEVNSFHSYCITKLGKDLEILAKAKDNTIEAFKHKDLPFFGIMWHIERESTQSLPSKTIWNLFLKNIKGNI